MMDVKVFEDEALTLAVLDGVLWEGIRYYLDLSELEPQQRKKVITEARIRAFSDFNARNAVCAIKVEGYVGELKLGEQLYDIRSKKFFIHISGNEQFAALMARIDEIMSGLKFKYSSPVRRDARISFDAIAPSDLERLDIFKSALKGGPKQLGLLDLVARILRQPHSAMRAREHERPIGNAQRINVNKLARTVGRRKLQSAGNTRPLHSPFVLDSADGCFLIPRTVPTNSTKSSYDTVENRFVKFLLQEIEGICQRVKSKAKTPELARVDAKEVLIQIRKILREPFFQGIGRLDGIPSHSPVLNGDDRYYNIFDIFLKSRLGVIDPLDKVRLQMRSSPLKDIATLYEIWCFAEIAGAFLKNEPEVSVESPNNRGLAYGTTWAGASVSLAYNPTYSAKKKGSYSVSFRPDIVIKAGSSSWIFDAKYRANRFSSFDLENPTEADVKASDLHKMHSYVDAIPGVISAIVVFPGTEADWFPRNTEAEDKRAETWDHGGVGSIPMLPIPTNNDLDELVKRIVKT